MWITERILSFMAPHECLGCTGEGHLLCSPCAGSLAPVPPRCYRCGRATPDYRTCQSCRRHSRLFGVYAVTFYDGLAKKLIYRFKFERAQAAASDVARAMAVTFEMNDQFIITHVPTAPSRVRQRGYDHAALIARELARQTGLPHASLLSRSGVERQVGQKRLVRREQMKAAFRAVHTPDLSGKHILLVDDVLTTGATCEAAAQTLREAGAKRVSAMVFAVA